MFLDLLLCGENYCRDSKFHVIGLSSQSLDCGTDKTDLQQLRPETTSSRRKPIRCMLATYQCSFLYQQKQFRKIYTSMKITAHENTMAYGKYTHIHV